MMLNYSEFLQNPVTMTIASSVIVTVILSVTVLGVLLVRQRRCLEKVQNISDSLSHLQDSFVRTNLNLESVADRLQTMEHQYNLMTQIILQKPLIFQVVTGQLHFSLKIQTISI